MALKIPKLLRSLASPATTAFLFRRKPARKPERQQALIFNLSLRERNSIKKSGQIATYKIGRSHTLCTQINPKVDITKLKPERVISNHPLLFLKRSFNLSDWRAGFYAKMP